MSEASLIEKFGLAFEQEGLPRIAGRIIGFLMINEGPFTLDDLADKLQISKTSASTNTRLLQQIGILDHISMTGDRRDYYILAQEHGERMFAMAKRRMQRFHDLLNEAVEEMPASRAPCKARLRHMQDFYEFLVGDLDERVEKWRSFQSSGKAGQTKNI